MTHVQDRMHPCMACMHLWHDDTCANCQVDDTISTLDLFINLARNGSLSFTYTAHGEEYFDYLLFTVNDERVHHTQSFWSSGMVQRRFVCGGGGGGGGGCGCGCGCGCMTAVAFLQHEHCCC